MHEQVRLQLIMEYSRTTSSSPNVFLSYAREDIDIAQKLYNDLENAGINVWFDKISLLPGQNWKIEIRKAIRKSSFFLALLSSNSVSKRGYVQKELKEALDVLDELPESKIFLIPARVDDCDPAHEKLREIHRVDLFPAYMDGLKNILRVIQPLDTSFLGPLLLQSQLGSRAMLEVEVAAPGDTQKSVTVTAFLDTGAVMTVLPESAIKTLGRLPQGKVEAIDYTGKSSPRKTYFVDIRIANSTFKHCEVIAVDRDYGYIGIDLLSNMIVLFDGPTQTVKVWVKSKA